VTQTKTSSGYCHFFVPKILHVSHLLCYKSSAPSLMLSGVYWWIYFLFQKRTHAHTHTHTHTNTPYTLYWWWRCFVMFSFSHKNPWITPPLPQFSVFTSIHSSFSSTLLLSLYPSAFHRFNYVLLQNHCKVCCPPHCSYYLQLHLWLLSSLGMFSEQE